MRLLPLIALPCALSFALSFALSARADTRFMPDGPPPEPRHVGEAIDPGVIAIWDDDAFTRGVRAEVDALAGRVQLRRAQAEAEVLRAARRDCARTGLSPGDCAADLAQSVERLRCVDEAAARAAALVEVTGRAAATLDAARLEPDPANAEVIEIERRKLEVAVARARQVEIEARACALAPDAGPLVAVEVAWQGEALTSWSTPR